MDFDNLIPTTQAGPEPDYFSMGFDDDEIINVDMFECMDTIKQPKKISNSVQGARRKFS
jgi:hypothetical protein